MASCSLRSPAQRAAWGLLGLASLSLTLLVVQGCAVAAPPKPLPLTAQIDALIGQAPCTRDDSCRSIGVGVKACGGPAAYRVWSVEATDGAALAVLVERHAAERSREIARTGEMSTCSIVVDTGALCRREAGAPSGRCQPRTQFGLSGRPAER